MPLNNYVLKNGLVLFADGFKQVDIMVEDHKIIKIAKDISANTIYDCTNKIITPGFVDVHVHLRDPGYTAKEDIKSGSYAAIKGGYTHIFAMPNTMPCMDNASEIISFNNRVKQNSYCNIKTFSAITKDLLGKQLVDFQTLNKLNIAGFSDDGRGVQNDDKMLKTMLQIKAIGTILSLHCEDEQELGKDIGAINEGEVSRKFNLKGINNASEWKMIERDITLMQNIEARCKYHVCHVSTKESVEIIKQGQLLGYDVSGEVTPHHLILTQDNITTLDSNYKMNPPLRTKDDKQALITALNEGIINIIATDHAPHQEIEKQQHISKAPFGIIGLETAFSVLNHYLVNTKQVSLMTILMAMTYNPARRFNLDYGIAVNKVANLAIIDLHKELTYTKTNLVSKAVNSPFLNQKLRGAVITTIVNGKKYDWVSSEE